MVSGRPQLLLAEEGAGRFSTVFRYGDGTEIRLPVTTPAKDLIAATETDYSKYRREIKRLRDAHPLFEERLDIPEADLVKETAWQRMVANDFAFDAETHYPETMLVLDLGAEEPTWELQTADELRREDQKGHQSLRDKYSKG